MISPKIKSPVTNAGATANADRTRKEYLTSTLNIQEKHSICADDFQSLFIASRYNLEPHMARLVCHLAGFGGEQ